MVAVTRNYVYCVVCAQEGVAVIVKTDESRMLHGQNVALCHAMTL